MHRIDPVLLCLLDSRVKYACTVSQQIEEQVAASERLLAINRFLNVSTHL
jgi:hypothetical protein